MQRLMVEATRTLYTHCHGTVVPADLLEVCMCQSRLFLLSVLFLPLLWAPASAEAAMSSATQECIDCHASIHPGIVEDWKAGRHALMTPRAAMQVQGPNRRVSSPQVPEKLLDASVGCAECHTLRPEAHADTFEHNGYRIHVVVSPDDCAVCHAEERAQYAENIMASAHGNLKNNTLYNDLERTILGKAERKGGGLHFSPGDPLTQAEGCYYCHGTRLEYAGTEQRDTDYGEMEFPLIKGWPNQGVGRINLDGSHGSCTSCHTRHRFSIATARKPYTCKECHAGPDVPAYKVYAASKHGNLFSSKAGQWNFDAVPWTVGKDFSAPTCAVCHISQVADTDGQVVSRRTHRMSDRLGWRIFGLIYAHPQPKSPDTTLIRNKSGLPLPTDLDGTPAADFLIGPEEIGKRRANMQAGCLACHSTSWVRGHFERLDHTIGVTNAQVRTATSLIETIWKKGYAKGPAQGASPFDEYIERRWCETWLFHANGIRFASAMGGGGDYGVFEDGRYQLSRTMMEMQDWIQNRSK
jgi:hydroxylamine dehydrogenase